ncbi:DUF1292 domain-containing protein [Eggerthellaceae bacterium zg-1084]|uniref:DUF1292 domain-containing protein n=1 Tax=Berryella wangjianweii TaxID=2734634 RepID=A0A6M8J498_9ACTN|nr:DUF1292 domain-containing protein [Berryella wangjianweii]NPD31105.1 DUF1292 domain-containing protein [Berryella wangjianweii]NPD31967.1 DUF1292 domain-containing protein [Eggerthellaceae bacterium zg-997]QKF07443.1 DUF1292 domain-containing protein [Berryella wangjianweii]
MREASAPNFCPPTEEGVTITLEDENGDCVELEFLGSIIRDEREYGFFFPVEEEEGDEAEGEVLVLEVVSSDEEGQPSEFELVLDEAIADAVFEEFREVAKELYDFAE